MISNVAFFVFGLLALVDGKMKPRPTESYTHSATLKTGNIIVYWKFNDTHITFEVHGETTGWIGIGFSPNGGMTRSDIFVGWVKNSEVRVTDRHGVENAFPPHDPRQDINVLGGAECNGWTSFKFSRQLAACEHEYDREITQNTQRLIWAWGNEDPTGDDIEPSDYHGIQRGVESMYFLQSAESPSGLPDGPTYETFDVVMEKFKIPEVDTYYNCKLLKVPKFKKKHHIVKYEPIIEDGNEVFVHHILVYRCGSVLHDPSELLQNARCFVPNMQHFQSCTTVIAQWAIGAEATIYPENAGFSIGGEGDPVFVQLEIHYDNPTKQSGVVDSSGIRFTYTETLRKYDVGVARIGIAVRGTEHIIPPGADNFLNVGHCTAKCWEDRMSSSEVESINVFSIMLHSHLAGRILKVRQIRDGVELPSPAFDDHYDFNYQEARYLHPHLTIEPKFHLQMECIYNTEDRTNVTQGGLGTRDEMCLAFLYYYPKIDLAYCISSISRKACWGFFGVDADSAELIPGYPGTRLSSWRLPHTNLESPKTMFDHLNEYAWTPENIKAFETYYNSIPHYELCVPANKSAKILTLFNVSEITSPYVELQKTCDEPQLTLSQKTSTRRCPSPRHGTTAATDRDTPGGTASTRGSLFPIMILIMSIGLVVASL